MSWWRLIRFEARAIFSHSAILLTVFGGVIFYSFLYPLPYIRQTPVEQQVAVVNLDGSQLSRRLERMVDATPQVRFCARAGSLAEAKETMLKAKLAGILVIPEHFYRDLLLGREPVLSFAGDASFFLVYSTVLEGMSAAGRTLAGEVKMTRLLQSGKPLVQARQQLTGVRVNPRPVFNSGMGYVDYVVPAVFVLILHQTLVMSVGILGGGQKCTTSVRAASVYWRDYPAWRVLTVRALIFGLLYVLAFLYYFGPSFSWYGIARLAAIGDLAAVLVPFLLAAIFLGVCLGQILPRPELVTLVVLLSSMPLVFTSGFVWPLSAIPAPIVAAVQLTPVVPAIAAFLRLNQLGADFAQVFPLWQQLWLQCLGYGSLAVWLLGHRRDVTIFEEKGEG